MTPPKFITDSYATQFTTPVVGLTQDGGILPDDSIFYAFSGGQPGDTGHLTWGTHRIEIVETRKSDTGGCVLVPSEGDQIRPTIGDEITMHLNWERRHTLMRMHTALHLLSVVVPLPVTGGAIGEVKSRLDFDMVTPPDDKDALSAQLNALIAEDYQVSDQWITDAELDANPSLVKTMSVKPPRGTGQVRLVRIGNDERQVDLQPCGGTHVKRTSEIGKVRISKIEKKGKQNRRIHLVFD